VQEPDDAINAGASIIFCSEKVVPCYPLQLNDRIYCPQINWEINIGWDQGPIRGAYGQE
jgi:hypothetical protein